MTAYGRDLGLELQCELYCDSSAALGIAQRAGIGKVRHLRTQGLWVQEVRVAGRITYKKVLGSKNPADLLTKHMTAELSQQHLTTLNQVMVGCRAESAPTLSSAESFVQSWVEGGAEWAEEIAADEDAEPRPKKVRFCSKVRFRAIPSVGRARPTPPRGTARRRHHNIDHIMIDETTHDEERARKLEDANIGAGAISRNSSSTNKNNEDFMGKLGNDGHTAQGLCCQGFVGEWADLDEDRACLPCASRWHAAPKSASRDLQRSAAADRCREASMGSDAGSQRQCGGRQGQPESLASEDDCRSERVGAAFGF